MTLRARIRLSPVSRSRRGSAVPFPALVAPAGRDHAGVVADFTDPYAPRVMRKEVELLPGSGAGVAEGQLRRQVRLGSKALYRVCACEGNYARVEVVEAPGLRSGAHYKFTRAAVALMELVDESAGATSVPASPLQTARAGQRQRHYALPGAGAGARIVSHGRLRLTIRAGASGPVRGRTDGHVSSSG